MLTGGDALVAGSVDIGGRLFGAGVLQYNLPEGKLEKLRFYHWGGRRELSWESALQPKGFDSKRKDAERPTTSDFWAIREGKKKKTLAWP